MAGTTMLLSILLGVSMCARGVLGGLAACVSTDPSQPQLPFPVSMKWTPNATDIMDEHGLWYPDPDMMAASNFTGVAAEANQVAGISTTTQLDDDQDASNNNTGDEYMKKWADSGVQWDDLVVLSIAPATTALLSARDEDDNNSMELSQDASKALISRGDPPEMDCHRCRVCYKACAALIILPIMIGPCILSCAAQPYCQGCGM